MMSDISTWDCPLSFSSFLLPGDLVFSKVYELAILTMIICCEKGFFIYQNKPSSFKSTQKEEKGQDYR